MNTSNNKRDLSKSIYVSLATRTIIELTSSLDYNAFQQVGKTLVIAEISATVDKVMKSLEYERKGYSILRDESTVYEVSKIGKKQFVELLYQFINSRAEDMELFYDVETEARILNDIESVYILDIINMCIDVTKNWYKKYLVRANGIQ